MNKAIEKLFNETTKDEEHLRYALESDRNAYAVYVNGISPYEVFYTEEEIEFMRTFLRYIDEICDGDTDKVAEFVACLPEDMPLKDINEWMSGIIKVEEGLRKIFQKKQKRPPSI